MEKPTRSKSKNKFFKLLQKAVPNLPRKNKNSDYEAFTEKSSQPILEGENMIKIPSFAEPISPKISCIGQIKQRKKVAKNIHLFLHKEMCPVAASRKKGSLMKPTFFIPEAEKIPSNMRNTHVYNNYVSKQMGGRKSSCALSEKAPCLDQMKRFPSCHVGLLSDFDWKIAQIETDDYMHEWKCNYSDSEDEDDDEEKEEELIISCSGSLIGVSGRDGYVQELEPRKEVNLWKRRTIDQPKPLQIRSPCTSLAVHRSRGRSSLDYF